MKETKYFTLTTFFTVFSLNLLKNYILESNEIFERYPLSKERRWTLWSN